MKRWIALLLAALMVFALCACGNTQKEDPKNTQTEAPKTDNPTDAPKTDDQTETKDKYLIGISCRTFASPYFVTITEQMKDYAKEGTEFIINAADDDPSKQITQVEDLIQSGCDAILICPANSSAIKPALAACKEAGIPVVVFDSKADDMDLVDCTVVSDNYVCGWQCGETLAKALNYKGDVAEYVDVSQQLGIERASGWRDAIAQYPDIHIVNTQEGAGDPPSALPKMEAILQANPEIVGLFAFNDPSANGCISAIAAAGRTGDILVVSIDGLDMALESITKGEQLATSKQRTDIIAEKSMEAAYMLIAGETPEHEIILDPTLVDASNVSDFYTPAA